MDTLCIAAHAKINFHLRILGRRPDGLHDIETVFQKIDLADEITLRRAERDEIEVVESPWPIGPNRENLAWRALERMRMALPGLPPVHIEVRKRIPPGAGLGGGSADAAATLRGLNDLFALDLPDAQLTELGRELGADVPFLVSPHRCAIGRGIGDELEAVEHTNHWPLTLIYPGAPSSTAEAYAAWEGGERTSDAPVAAAVAEALISGDLEGLARAIHSDFTVALRRRLPSVDQVMRWMQEQSFQAVWPTGSGSSVVGLGAHVEKPVDVSLPAGCEFFTASMLL